MSMTLAQQLAAKDFAYNVYAYNQQTAQNPAEFPPLPAFVTAYYENVLGYTPVSASGLTE